MEDWEETEDWEELDVIRVSGMTFYAYHGTTPAERQLGQRFEVDVELFVNTYTAGHTDALEDTIDYVKVYEIVEEIVLEGEFNLIEAIAEAIAEALLRRLPTEMVQVRVRKPNVAIPGITGGVEVEIIRE